MYFSTVPFSTPTTPFGIAVVQFETEAELQAFIAEDPTRRAGLSRFTYAPMILGGAQAPRG